MPVPADIEEWVEEIRQRPASAEQMLRRIAARLQELEQTNSELLADNIMLRSGEKTAELEQRIAALEYQLELLRRLPPPAADPAGAEPAPASDRSAQAFLFRAAGHILRLPINMEDRWRRLARLEPPPADQHAGLLLGTLREDLLCVFDGGRSQTLSAAELPALEEAGWAKAARALPRPGEKLAALLPLTRLPLSEVCVQVSRRACAKLMPQSAFQTAVSKGMVGAGIRRRPDQAAFLALCNRDQAVLLFTAQGMVAVLPVSSLPYSVEEVMLLAGGDYIEGGLVFSGEKELLFLTQTGKLLRKPGDWLEPAGSFRARGQPAFSAARRESGTRLVGAAALGGQPEGICAALTVQGGLWAGPLADLIASGSLETDGEEIAAAAFLPRLP